MDVSMGADEEEEGSAAASASSSSSAAAAASDAHASHFHKLKRPAVDELMNVPRAFKKQAIAAALAMGAPSSTAHATPVPNNNSAAHAAIAAHIPPPPSSSPSAASSSSSAPNYHHQLFTYDQVASIVRNAVEMREASIRAEYDQTLQRLLQEQFDSFSTFNKDYISRNMLSKDQEDPDSSYYS
jgi:hypothetical protein